MKYKHVVLRASRLASRDVLSGAAILESNPPPQVSVQIEELDRRDIAMLTRDTDVSDWLLRCR